MLEEMNKGLRKAKTQFFLFLGVFLLSIFAVGYFVFDYKAEAANPPEIITYQGKLLVSGSPATTTQAMYFKIYDEAAGGNLLYTASGTTAVPLHVSTTPSNGLFSINLGDTTIPTNALDSSIFKNNSALYLEVKIGATTLSPRKRITASPYAINSIYLNGVSATSTASSSTYIPVSASDGSFNFNTTTFNHNVGIGTSNPTEKLTVSGGNLAIGSGSSTSTLGADFFSFASSPTAVGGVFYIDSFGNISASGTINIFGNSFLTNVSSTNITASGYVTTTDLTVSGALNLPANSIADAMVNDNITASNYLLLAGGILSGGLSFDGNNGILASTSTIGSLMVTSTLDLSTANVTGLSSSKLSDFASLAFLSGLNIFTATNTFATTTVASSTIVTANINNLNVIGSSTSTIYSGLTINGIGGGLSVGSLINCDTIDTDANGYLVCGADMGGSSNFSSPLTVTDGITTSTILANGLYIATSTSNMLGLFNTDSTGNVSASGSVFAFGDITSAGIIYANNGLVSSVSSTFSNNLNVAGSLGLNGLLNASSSILSAGSLMMNQGAGYNFGKFYIDSNGNVSASGTLKVFGLTTLANTIISITSGGSIALAGSGVALNLNTSAVINVNNTGRINVLSGGGVTFNSGSTLSVPAGFFTDTMVADTITASNYLPLAGGTLSGALNVGGLTWLSGGMMTGTTTIGALTVSSTLDITNAIVTGLTVSKISDNASLALLAGNQTFSGVNTFAVTTTLATTGGNVGIGTSTPSEKLHQYGGNFLLSAGDPKIAGSVSGLGTPTSVYVSGKYAYVADEDGYLRVFDISNPLVPSSTGSLFGMGAASSVYISGKYAFVTERNLPGNLPGVLHIVDISNPSNLVSISSVSGIGYPKSVYVSGKYAYILDNGNSYLYIINVSNPVNPVKVGSITGMGAMTSIYVSGERVYAASSDVFYVIDVSVPSLPAIVGSVTGVGEPSSIYVSGKYAYLADYTGDALRVVDVSNPFAPTSTGFVSGMSWPTSVYVSGKYAYVVSNRGVLLVDISNPFIPVSVGLVSSVGGASSVFVSGKYAYVVSAISNSLYTVDISGIDAPSANIGNIATSDLTVYENVDIGNNLSIRNGLNIGTGGILSNGAISIFTSSTGSNTDIFNIFASSTNSVLPIFTVKDNGNVGVGTSSPYAKLSVMDTGVDSLRDVFVISTSTDGLIFKVDSYGQTFADGAYTGTGADYAEYYYTNDVDLVGGEVVCLDSVVDMAVRRCTQEGDNNVMGVISTKPSVIGNSRAGYASNPHYKVVGMLGQVPVKVSIANGEIKKGDKLTSSNIPGVAIKATRETKILGTALEDYSSAENGVVTVFIGSGWNNLLYQGLSIETENNLIKVGSEALAYNMDLYGGFSMKGSGINKLSFASSTLFESNISSLDSEGAFVFNTPNYSASSSNNFILSLRSGGQSVFSVSSNGDLRTIGDVYAKSLHLGEDGQPGDLAEKVDIAIDDTVEAGDVVIVDPNSPDTYRRSSGAFEQSVAGVVSTNPTIVVGDGRTDYTAVVAMVGRVPVKVSTENGSISRGDLLVSASTTGYAMKYDAGKDEKIGMIGVIGVALEPLTDGKGKIMTLIRTGWAYNRNQTFASLQQSMTELASAQALSTASSSQELGVGTSGNQLVFTGGNLDLQGGILLNVASIIGKNDKWAIDNEGNFISKVDTTAGKKEMYAMQSPVSEFVFSSSSQLIAGEARIDFDNIIKEIIDSTAPLKISVTLTSGEAKGVYVSAKDVNGFVVKELQGGNSNATFDWVVVAKRKGVNVQNVVVDPIVIPDVPVVIVDPVPTSTPPTDSPTVENSPPADPVNEPIPTPDPVVVPEPTAPIETPVPTVEPATDPTPISEP